MTERKSLKKRITLVYQRSSTVTKVSVLAALVLSITALLGLQVARQDKQEHVEQLRIQAAMLEQENERREKQISRVDSVDGVREIAGEVLGLVDANTVFFEPNADHAD